MYGITCYILPFMFFYGPGLLMQGEVLSIVLAIVSGGLGVFCIASFVVGYMRNDLQSLPRVAIGVAGIALLHQSVITDLVGLGLLVGVWLLFKPEADATTA